MITTILINNYELNISEDIAIPLNFSIQDFRNPEKRKRSFSKSIQIQGTSENMIFFSSAYSLNIDLEASTLLSYTPNEAPQAIVKRGDLVIFRGRMKLNQVTIKNNEYTFDCTLFSDAVDIFAKLKNIKLNELNWSEYDHPLTRQNVTNSWNTSVIKNNVAVQNFDTIGNGYDPKGFGYLYPIADYGYTRPNATTWRTSQVVPHVYVLECVKKILDYAYADTDIEVDYTTNFFTNSNIKKMIYGFGGGEQLKLSQTAINATKWETFNATYSESFVLSKAGVSGRGYALNSIGGLFTKKLTYGAITQNQNVLNTSTGEIFFKVKALYTFTINIALNYASSGAPIKDEKSSNITQIVLNVNGLNKVFKGFKTFVNQNYVFQTTFDYNIKNGDIVKIILAPYLEMEAQDVTINVTDFDMTISAQKDLTLTDNAIISLNSVIPPIPCSDFLKGILDVFYAMPSDPIFDVVTGKSYVYINSFQDFYKPQEEHEVWTKLLDKEREIVIQSNSLIEGKTYYFRYKEEKDYLNLEYKNLTGNNYGELERLIDTWQTGEKVFQLPFSTYHNVSENGLKFMRIIDQSSGVVKPYKGGGVLSFYNGVRSGICKIRNIDNDTETISFIYPFVHHIRFSDADNFDTPIFDLHFEARQYAFDNINVVPADNIYSYYYSRFINEMTSINSKLLMAYFKLDDSNISKLDFGKLIMIDGALYRLFTIKDYDNYNLGTTQCELIKFLG